MVVFCKWSHSGVWLYGVSTYTWYCSLPSVCCPFPHGVVTGFNSFRLSNYLFYFCHVFCSFALISANVDYLICILCQCRTEFTMWVSNVLQDLSYLLTWSRILCRKLETSRTMDTGILSFWIFFQVVLFITCHPNHQKMFIMGVLRFRTYCLLCVCDLCSGGTQ